MAAAAAAAAIGVTAGGVTGRTLISNGVPAWRGVWRYGVIIMAAWRWHQSLAPRHYSRPPLSPHTTTFLAPCLVPAHASRGGDSGVTVTVGGQGRVGDGDSGREQKPLDLTGDRRTGGGGGGTGGVCVGWFGGQGLEDRGQTGQAP